jgi:aspartate aminotransferase-like enzyme
MKKTFLLSFLALILLSAKTSFSQSDKGSFILSGTGGLVMPLYKSNIELVDKIITGLEGNYFVADGVSVTGGADFYVGSKQTMVAFGTRLYPGAGSFYFRHKAMVNVKSRFNNDFMVGMGNDFELTGKLAAELNLDYHFVTKAVGVKFGLALTL